MVDPIATLRKIMEIAHSAAAHVTDASAKDKLERIADLAGSALPKDQENEPGPDIK